MVKNYKLMVFLILSVWCSWINATLDTIIIDQGQDDPVKVAVVPFKMSGDLEEAVNLSDIIAFDQSEVGNLIRFLAKICCRYRLTLKTFFLEIGGYLRRTIW